MLWLLCIIVEVAYFPISTHYWGGIASIDVHFYYFMNTLDAIFCIINAHGVIGISYWILKYLQDALITFFTILSSNITNIYIAQWFYIPLAVIIIIISVQKLSAGRSGDNRYRRFDAGNIHTDGSRI